MRNEFTAFKGLLLFCHNTRQATLTRHFGNKEKMKTSYSSYKAALLLLSTAVKKRNAPFLLHNCSIRGEKRRVFKGVHSAKKAGHDKFLIFYTQILFCLHISSLNKAVKYLV